MVIGMKCENINIDSSRILLGAHRGDRKHFPENTMAAMRAAVQMGCDAIETDVRMTKDGHLVLIHDRDVSRTTDQSGLIDEMSLEEVRALDAGSWKGAAFAGEKIPTVEEFLSFIAPTNVIINWELKEYPVDLGKERAFACADRLIDLIDQFGMKKRSIMNSFSDQLLEHIADQYPGQFPIHGYLHYKEPKDFSKKPLESFLDWAAVWRKDECHPEGFAEDYEEILSLHILPCILVPDEKQHYQHALEMGCRMFTSDDPETALKILRELGCRS